MTHLDYLFSPYNYGKCIVGVFLYGLTQDKTYSALT